MCVLSRQLWFLRNTHLFHNLSKSQFHWNAWNEVSAYFLLESKIAFDSKLKPINYPESKIASSLFMGEKEFASHRKNNRHMRMYECMEKTWLTCICVCKSNTSPKLLFCCVSSAVNNKVTTAVLLRHHLSCEPCHSVLAWIW